MQPSTYENNPEILNKAFYTITYRGHQQGEA
jgi:hypothetical protein